MRFVSVAVPVPFLDLLTYKVPDGLDPPARGARVVVPLGKRVVTGSEDNTARLWSVATRKLLLKLEGHTAPVTSVAFTPLADGGARFAFDAPQPAVAPGQAAVIYDGSRLLGGSWIAETVSAFDEAPLLAANA